MNKTILMNNIISLRKKNGLTQKDLAEKLNYSDKVISKWERGETMPDVLALTEISTCFGISIDKLVLGTISNIETEYLKTRKLDIKRIKGPSKLVERSIWIELIIYLVVVMLIIIQGFNFMFLLIATGISIGYTILWSFITVNVVVESKFKGHTIKVTNAPTKLRLYIDDVLVDELDSIFGWNTTLTGKIGEHLIKAKISGIDKFRCSIFVE